MCSRNRFLSEVIGKVEKNNRDGMQKATVCRRHWASNEHHAGKKGIVGQSLRIQCTVLTNACFLMATGIGLGCPNNGTVYVQADVTLDATGEAALANVDLILPAAISYHNATSCSIAIAKMARLPRVQIRLWWTVLLKVKHEWNNKQNFSEF